MVEKYLLNWFSPFRTILFQIVGQLQVSWAGHFDKLSLSFLQEHKPLQFGFLNYVLSSNISCVSNKLFRYSLC